VKTVGQIKSNTINNNNTSQSRHSEGRSRSNIRGRSRNVKDFVRSQNVVGRKKSRGDIRSRRVNLLRKSHNQLNTRRHGEQEIPKNKEDPEMGRNDDMNVKTRSKSRLSPERIPDDLLQSVPKLAESRLQNRSFQNRGRKGHAKPSKTISEHSVQRPQLPIERGISKPGQIIATTYKILLKQGRRVFNTHGLNQKFRDNSDRKKGNEKGRSFNKKPKQSRKKEINIRMRFPTTQNIPAEKDYNESNSSGGKWNGNNKSLSTYSSTHVRAYPLLRILKKTNTKNIQDNTFLPTAPLKTESFRHSNEALMHHSVHKRSGFKDTEGCKNKG
jgi:hypothetical protein